MRDYAKGIQAALCSFEKTLMDSAQESISLIVAHCSDDEVREIARTGGLDLFMQKTLFNIIRSRRDGKTTFQKFFEKVTGRS